MYKISIGLHKLLVVLLLGFLISCLITFLYTLTILIWGKIVLHRRVSQLDNSDNEFEILVWMEKICIIFANIHHLFIMTVQLVMTLFIRMHFKNIYNLFENSS